jgi:hypothetical protein
MKLKGKVMANGCQYMAWKEIGLKTSEEENRTTICKHEGQLPIWGKKTGVRENNFTSSPPPENDENPINILQTVNPFHEQKHTLCRVFGSSWSAKLIENKIQLLVPSRIGTPENNLQKPLETHKQSQENKANSTRKTAIQQPNQSSQGGNRAASTNRIMSAASGSYLSSAFVSPPCFPACSPAMLSSPVCLRGLWGEQVVVNSRKCFAAWIANVYLVQQAARWEDSEYLTPEAYWSALRMHE